MGLKPRFQRYGAISALYLVFKDEILVNMIKLHIVRLKARFCLPSFGSGD